MFRALYAQILVKQNKYKQAQQFYYQLLQLAVVKNNPAFIIIANNGIGWVNMEMNQNEQALKWFYSAINITGDVNLLERHANVYSNIAAVFIGLSKYDSAEAYAQKSIAMSRRSENLFYLANALNILADVYINSKRASLAEKLLNEAIVIRKQIGDPFYIVSDISQFALFYANNNQPTKGIAVSNEGIIIARTNNLQSKLPYLYFALAQNYRADKNFQKYGETMEIVSSLKDSVYIENSAREMVEMEARYNSQLKENIIIQQKLDIVSKNYALYGSLIILALMVTIGYLLFLDYQRRQKIILMTLKEEEKLMAREAILMAEEKERKRIAADLHDNMGAYATAISSNIDDLIKYEGSQNIPLMEIIKENAAEIMANLRDTIWILNSTEILLTSVSDRFKKYVQKIRGSYKHILIEVHEQIDQDVTLSPEVALNTLRIMQEALHNAIKHSDGNKVSILIVSNQQISISIIDNGNGFKEGRKQENCYGIENMKNRAQSNGWNLQINKGETTGTTVILADT